MLPHYATPIFYHEQSEHCVPAQLRQSHALCTPFTRCAELRTPGSRKTTPSVFTKLTTAVLRRLTNEHGNGKHVHYSTLTMDDTAEKYLFLLFFFFSRSLFISPAYSGQSVVTCSCLRCLSRLGSALPYCSIVVSHGCASYTWTPLQSLRQKFDTVY